MTRQRDCGSSRPAREGDYYDFPAICDFLYLGEQGNGAIWGTLGVREERLTRAEP
jgi:hypothetical protein